MFDFLLLLNHSIIVFNNKHIHFKTQELFVFLK